MERRGPGARAAREAAARPGGQARLVPGARRPVRAATAVNRLRRRQCSARPELYRAGRDLYFQVTQSTQSPPVPPGYGGGADGQGDGDPSPPGFRYDLACDEAVATPQALAPPAPDVSYPGGLPSYPFFAYEEPGARLFPGSWFSASLAVGDALVTRCGHELGAARHRCAFDPLARDCARMLCNASTTDDADPAARRDERGRPQGACCDATQVSEEGARDRAVVMRYCGTLIEWGDAVMRRGHSPEAFRQARVLYSTAARILGPRPRTIGLAECDQADAGGKARRDPPGRQGQRVRPGLRSAQPAAHGPV